MLRRSTSKCRNSGLATIEQRLDMTLGLYTEKKAVASMINPQHERTHRKTRHVTFFPRHSTRPQQHVGIYTAKYRTTNQPFVLTTQNPETTSIGNQSHQFIKLYQLSCKPYSGVGHMAGDMETSLYQGHFCPNSTLHEIISLLQVLMEFFCRARFKSGLSGRYKFVCQRNIGLGCECHACASSPH